MECPKCKKKNDIEANFCSRCGYDISQNKIQKCPICLDDKKLEVLVCGHLVCRVCINSQFKIKKECPNCRHPLLKCQKCGSFRVHTEKNLEKCLDCKEVTRIVDNTQIMSRPQCIECHSKRLLYNHVNDSWNCLDCFQNFTIQNNQVRISSRINPTTLICVICCSNNLIIDSDMEYKCENCGKENTPTKCITLEEYSLLRIKTKDEVNIPKVKKCRECQEKNI